MTTPTIRVELATDGGPLTAAPTWTTLPATDVLSFSLQEGRQSPTDTATQPSTCSITFDNRARKYDPLYSAGAYFGELVPGRQIRVTIIEADLTETVVFRGVVGPEGWRQIDYRHPATSSAAVSCLDWLGMLGSWPGDLPPFENYLRALAVNRGIWGVDAPSVAPGSTKPGVLHWRLDDQAGWSGEQTFSDPLPGRDVYSPYGVERHMTRLPAIEVPSSDVASTMALRAGLSGSLDTGLGGAEVSFAGTAGIGSSTDAEYDATWGFAVRLRSYAPIDLAPLVVDSGGNGNGVFIDRDGGLVVILDEGITQVSTDVSSSFRLKIGVTYFVTVSFNDVTDDVFVYIDGVQKASNLAYPSLGVGPSTTAVWVGSDGFGFGDNVPVANVCDFFIIRAVLTSTEVATLHSVWRGVDGVLAGDAASAILTTLGVPHTAAGGRVGMGEQSGAQSPASLLQTIERTELGRMYVSHRDQQVALVSFEALTASTGRHAVSQFTFSDQAADTGAGFMRYSNPQVVNLPAVNQASASNGLVSWSMRDEASIALYGVSAVSNSMGSGTETDPLAVAQYLLELNPAPTTAVRSVTVQPTSAVEFGEVLDAQLFDLCTLKRQPHNLGAVLSTSMLVEGRSLTISDGTATWEATFFLREHDAYPFWRWNDGEFEAATSVYAADRNGRRLGP